MNTSLIRRFQSPPNQYRGMPFWAWNGKLEPEELRRQIRLMHGMGLGGFFMHSRVGLDTPYLSDEWFECVEACIEEAKRLGMQAWLYDEDRWPSGAAGGIVTKNPRYRQRYLMMIETRCGGDLTWDADTVAAFTAIVDGTTARDVHRVARRRRPRLTSGRSLLIFRIVTAPLSSWYNGYTYLDTMNHQAVAQFIRISYEPYRKRVGQHFGETVPGFFTDEPNHGDTLSRVSWNGVNDVSVPWTPRLPDVFRERYDYDLLDHLPEVFLDVDADGRGPQAITPARHDYHDCTTFLFTDAFGRQIGRWCEKNGIVLTGHVLMEGDLSTQANVVGSCMRFYEHMQAPGIDMLTERWREYDTAKQVSSAARQFGQKWRLTETYGCTGWDFPFAGHKAVSDWQVALGINLRCPHLSWYTMEGQAKRDYPASVFYQSPWWRAYPKVENYFARIHVVMTQGQEVRDLLVIHPIESTWTLCRKNWTREAALEAHDEMIVDLRDSILAANIDFDYGDEEILSRHGKVTRRDGRAVLRVARARYTTVLVPPMLTIRRSTLDLLKRLAAAGGKVVFAGKAPRYVDARPSADAAQFARTCPPAPARGRAAARAVENCRRVSITDASGKQIAATLHLLREDRRAFYLFLCNTGHNCARGKFSRSLGPPVRKRTLRLEDVRIRGFAGCAKPAELDPDSGKVYRAEAARTDGGWEIRTSLPALASRLFVIPKSATGVRLPRRPMLRDVRKRRLGRGPWRISLSESNNLVLDRPRYRLGSGPWRKATEILRVDRTVRDALGVAHRGGLMVQPWARDKNRTLRTIPMTLRYRFGVEHLPSGDLHLAIERPDRFDVHLNGHAVSPDAECGWWVDRSLRRLPLNPAHLRLGGNELTLSLDYDEEFSGLEVLYLLGPFGVALRGSEARITQPPQTLRIGDWVRQGLPFYSGSVTYAKTIRPQLTAGDRLFVRVPAYEGVAVRVLADGSEAGIIAWEPNEADITDLCTRERIVLQLEVIGHRRNSHGPLHHADKRPAWVGAEEYVTGGRQWTDAYQLVPCGLTVEPILVVRG